MAEEINTLEGLEAVADGVVAEAEVETPREPRP